MLLLRDNFQVKSRLVIAQWMNVGWFFSRPSICFSEYFLEQSKSFVLHQNQVSSCKGYGYWFKKFKDFPSLSSDGAASSWSLYVATFRPTLDSTFSIITTRLVPVRLEPSAPSPHFLLRPDDPVMLTLVPISCLHHRYRRLRTGDSMWPPPAIAPRHH